MEREIRGAYIVRHQVNEFIGSKLLVQEVTDVPDDNQNQITNVLDRNRLTDTCQNWTYLIYVDKRTQ